MATISSHYFRECLVGAQRSGIDTRQLLLDAGIDPDLPSDPQGRGDVHAMARLVRGIWSALDDEFMGFTAQRAKVGLFGLMLRYAAYGESLEQVLRAGVRFYELTRTDIGLSLSKRGDQALCGVWLSRPELDPAHYLTEFWMMTWHRLAGWITGGPLPLRWASFTFDEPVSYREEFKYLFPCEHRFGEATNGFAIDAKYLGLPVVRTREEVKAMLRDAPLMFMTMPSSELGLVRRVRAALLPKAAPLGAFASLEEVAVQLHMTPQTLRRKLAREGSSYREIKENIRRDIAIQKVFKCSARIEDIALAVGYVESRSFTRAFQQWTGYSPLQYRKKFGHHAGLHAHGPK